MLKKGQRVKINRGWYKGNTGVLLDEYNLCSIILDIGLVIEEYQKDLTPVEPSIDNLMVGDVVIREGDKERIVMFIGNDYFIVLSWEYPHQGTLASPITKEELKKDGYKVISPSKTILTKKMIADKFNIDEDNMEIQ